jgi:DNA-binding NtrC family response regulator
MKVLLVDDESKFAVMLSKRLNLRGIDTDYVHTGKDALEMVGQNRYDVVILDVKMPGISGIELQRRLMDMDPALKTILLTGHGSHDDFKAGSAEAVCYLSKPLKIEKLLQILHQIDG